MAMVQSTCGHLATVVGRVTIATVMATPTVSIHCPSAVLPRTVTCRGTRKLARPLLRPLTVAVREPSARL